MMPWDASWAHCLSMGAEPGMPSATTMAQSSLLDEVHGRDGQVLEAGDGARDDGEGLAVARALLSSARAAAPMS